jgi:hypothetical protein
VSELPEHEAPARGALGSDPTLALDGFAREAVEQEAERLGISASELVTFAVLYYLADLDSGRIARRISRSPYPDKS